MGKMGKIINLEMNSKEEEEFIDLLPYCKGTIRIHSGFRNGKLYNQYCITNKDYERINNHKPYHKK